MICHRQKLEGGSTIIRGGTSVASSLSCCGMACGVVMLSSCREGLCVPQAQGMLSTAPEAVVWAHGRAYCQRGAMLALPLHAGTASLYRPSSSNMATLAAFCCNRSPSSSLCTSRHCGQQHLRPSDLLATTTAQMAALPPSCLCGGSCCSVG